MRSWLLVVFGIIISGLIVIAYFYNQNLPKSEPLEVPLATAAGASSDSPSPAAPLNGSPSAQETLISTATPAPISSPIPILASPLTTQTGPGAPESSPSGSIPTISVQPTAPFTPANPGGPDLAIEGSGLSKATVTVTTNQGVIKFKFYSNDAPRTIKRLIELIQSGFYNGLTFHRVVPGFVVQGGDPSGNGTGGSGQKLEAEFNNRKHTLGTVAMARAADPNSADSQFYISLGTHPHLDHNYTVFGQVVEGIEVVKKLKIGDKMTEVTIR